MAQATEEQDTYRDGLSQAERHLAALRPDYVAVDERSLEDLLAFAKAYAGKLNFFEAEHGEIRGDWSPFFAEGGKAFDLAEAITYLEAPEKFSAEKARPYARPHFALFLTFL